MDTINFAAVKAGIEGFSALVKSFVEMMKEFIKSFKKESIFATTATEADETTNQ